MIAVHRREFLRLTIAGVLAIPLTGCGGESGPVSRVAEETLQVAVPGVAAGLDPHAWADTTGPRTFSAMFDALTFVQNDGQLRPALALGWSQPNPTTWQFRLRVADAKFHNGETFGPDSVELTFQRLLDQDPALPVSRLVNTVARLDVVNAWTVNLITKEPDPLLPRRLSLVYLLPPAYFGRVGPDGFAQAPIGTGFWMFQQRDSQGLSMTVFRDTWRGARGADPPPLKQLRLDAIASAELRSQQLLDLDYDVATDLGSFGPSLRGKGFQVDSTNLAASNNADQAWQASVFGASLGTSTDVTASCANVKGLIAEPNGSWWFDRVTKTALQRVAVAGGA
ncbi:MAG: hypothetical protein JOZ39_05835 [Chloroflexi bacterium]|nr:hypothetical protein [Chloroflexota bacterium]